MTVTPAVPTVSTIASLLEECVAVFRRHLHMPDPGSLFVILAAVVANVVVGDPLWLLLVGPPGSGKSEMLSALYGLPDVHRAATITEAALLSGTPAKEKPDSARGGLLRVMGAFGIIVAKDFGSVLSMHRDARGALLAALREIYDGSWTRHLGTDGGRTLDWTGKVGFIGGVTPSVDSHHSVMGTMGAQVAPGHGGAHRGDIEAQVTDSQRPDPLTVAARAMWQVATAVDRAMAFIQQARQQREDRT